MKLDDMYKSMGIGDRVTELARRAEESLAERFERIDEHAQVNQLKVLKAMQDARLAEQHFSPTTGYGYNDIGREALEKIYAELFHTEDALVRQQITCGTHALNIALSGNLRPGDELLSPVGKPYDTMDEIIGIRPSKGSLAEYGVTYRQVELKEDGTPDLEAIKAAVGPKTKLATIQRSRGYATRPTLSVKQIGQIIDTIKSVKPDCICMVDNCYGELVDDMEPTEVGADLCVGSLIKNLGGGMAPIGGYIVGKHEYVENAAYRLTSPGLGKEVGASLGITRDFTQGLFYAPYVIASALKGAIFAAKLYENLGYEVFPKADEPRHDIIQAVNMNTPEGLVAFCQGIQAASPVDSYVVPEPWPMPGYDDDVIMAAGTFISGASIELSADGPMRPPYTVFFQGGLNYAHARFGICMSLQRVLDLKKN